MLYFGWTWVWYFTAAMFLLNNTFIQVRFGRSDVVGCLLTVLGSSRLNWRQIFEYHEWWRSMHCWLFRNLGCPFLLFLSPEDVRHSFEACDPFGFFHVRLCSFSSHLCRDWSSSLRLQFARRRQRRPNDWEPHSLGHSSCRDRFRQRNECFFEHQLHLHWSNYDTEFHSWDEGTQGLSQGALGRHHLRDHCVLFDRINRVRLHRDTIQHSSRLWIAWQWVVQKGVIFVHDSNFDLFGCPLRLCVCTLRLLQDLRGYAPQGKPYRRWLGDMGRYPGLHLDRRFHHRRGHSVLFGLVVIDELTLWLVLRLHLLGHCLHEDAARRLWPWVAFETRYPRDFWLYSECHTHLYRSIHVDWWNLCEHFHHWYWSLHILISV